MGGSVVTGADLLCQALVAAKVRVVFGIPGGAIMPLYHALPDHPELRHVLCRHEQGAGHAAQGYARATGRLGVCLATSGPGATNLVTPIADAWMDGTPLLAITGQVPTSLLGTDAFQETDIIGITLPIVKHSFLVTDAQAIPAVVDRAVCLALSGRPGPVLIDVTKDAQQTRLGGGRCAPGRDVEPPSAGVENRGDGTPALIARATAVLGRAERPMILAGQGVLQSGAAPELARLAECLDAPVATTLLGQGAMPNGHPLSIGLVGMHGDVAVNRALQRCDVLLVVGARLDDRVTGKVDRFAPGATVVHVDIEPAQLGRTVPAHVELSGDARDVLRMLLNVMPAGSRAEWRAGIAREAEVRRVAIPAAERTAFPPAAVYRALDAHLAAHPESLVVTDVGQHQMWAARLLAWRSPGAHLTSGGAGTMGFAIPAALGAALGRPGVPVWAVVGDGGFQMTSQELATLVQEDVRTVKIAVINNGYLGMVRQWQQYFHGGRYSATPLTGPDFAALARSYGVAGITVEQPDEAAGAVARAAAIDGPVVIDFRVEREANVLPLVPPGSPLDAMIEEESIA